MELPKKIDPCPIAEVVVEIRFESDLPEDAIFGVVYDKFKEQYSSVEKLPILQIPEAIRSQDINLKYNPHYRIQKDNFLIQIGPKVFSLANVKDYCGWDNLSVKIYETFSSISELKILKQILRFGLRYINMFEGLNIYDKSNLELTLQGERYSSIPINLALDIPVNNFINHLKVINNAQVLIEGKIRQGSIIDIDTAIENFSGDFFGSIKDIIEKAHIHEKELFYSLLKEDFIQSLNPIY